MRFCRCGCGIQVGSLWHAVAPKDIEAQKAGFSRWECEAFYKWQMEFELKRAVRAA